MFLCAKIFIFCVKISVFGRKMRFFTISESEIRKKKSKILLESYSIG